MTADIEAWLAEAELPERSVSLCLQGSLVAEYERLDAQLRQAAQTAGSLAGDSPAQQIAAQMEVLHERMLADARILRFRALPPRVFSDLRAKQPLEKKPDQTDDEHADAYHVWVCGIVAASCVDPVMTAEQVDRLSQTLSDGLWRLVTAAAWDVNTSAQDIPFSAAASALTRLSDERLRQPEPAASPEVGSLAGSSEPSPSTSTETTAG